MSILITGENKIFSIQADYYLSAPRMGLNVDQIIYHVYKIRIISFPSLLAFSREAGKSLRKWEMHWNPFRIFDIRMRANIYENIFAVKN